jgi:hypothetical protein
MFLVLEYLLKWLAKGFLPSRNMLVGCSMKYYLRLMNFKNMIHCYKISDVTTNFIFVLISEAFNSKK